MDFTNAMGLKKHAIFRPAAKIIYGVKTVNGVRETTDAKDAAAIFLYEKQVGNNPHWTVFPGRYETRDFFTVNDDFSGEFLIDEKFKMAMLFDNDDDAYNVTIKLANEGKRYGVYLGGVNNDGFVAGKIDFEHPADEYTEKLLYDDYLDYEEE